MIEEIFLDDVLQQKKDILTRLDVIDKFLSQNDFYIGEQDLGANLTLDEQRKYCSIGVFWYRFDLGYFKD